MQLELSKVLIVVFGSLIAGFMGGQVGGGGLITLPLLLFVGMNPIIAMGTNRFAGVFLNLAGAVGFYKQKKLAMKHYVIFGALALAGGVLGALILFLFPIDESLLKKLIIAVIFLMLLLVFFKKNMGLTDTTFQLKGKHYFLILMGILVISIYGGIMGVAMTTMFAMLFALNRQSYLQSMSYSLYLSVIVSVVSAGIFIFHNAVDYPYAILQTIGGSVGAIYGSKFALKKGNKWLRNLIFIAMLLILVKLALDLF